MGDVFNPMQNPVLTALVLSTLRQILAQDSRSVQPVVKAVSLQFWEHLKQWVDHLSGQSAPFIIAIGGPSGSGKSLVRNLLTRALDPVAPVASFTQDNYYRDFEQDFPELPLERFYHEIDFDDPAHIRFQDLLADLNRLCAMRFGEVLPISRLIYGTPAHKPTIVSADLPIPVTPFLITEGIHAFYSPLLRERYHFKIYVDVNESTRRERWLARNRRENRGTTDNMWQTTVQCLQSHILPTRGYADLVLNSVASAEDIEQFFRLVVEALSIVGRKVA